MALVDWVWVWRAVSGTTSIPQVDGVGVGAGVGVGLAVSGTMRIPLNDGVGVGGIDLTVDEVPATNTSVSVLDNVDTEKKNCLKCLCKRRYNSESRRASLKCHMVGYCEYTL